MDFFNRIKNDWQSLTIGQFLSLYKGLVGAVASFLFILCLLVSVLLGWSRPASDQAGSLQLADTASQSSQVLTSSASSADQNQDGGSPDQADLQSAASQPADSALSYVDVKGAVKAPGIYRVEAGMRVQDAVDLAGGLTEQADSQRVNLAQLLTDQMVVFIPSQGQEEVPAMMTVTNDPSSPGGQAATVGGSGPSQTNLININTADASQLQEISGIGEKKAADIIAHRETKGAFQSVDDLTQVSGIGEKTLAKIRDQVTVQ
ncbi:hypothetical protein AWM75_02845 [Aerococcus urinaehominis]|uniref:Uncharacterized protein n=1 Tax=Aerococcus urinaehominis TaxID=128944 RepID=A0A0X8FKJ0_9LACT|nr:helix-hairpin-helix domain-containing protein [Aerococcus urinaehominis]AMB98999.1 hypothetical protein AWM75_02845 [Aerococcus urinaehominis]SDM62096.1 competence protein ComEA [Aerococcus urinaehominis]